MFIYAQRGHGSPNLPKSSQIISFIAFNGAQNDRQVNRHQTSIGSSSKTFLSVLCIVHKLVSLLWPHRQIPMPIMLMQVSPRQMAQVFSCIMCIQRHAFQMLQRSVLNSCVRCSLTFAYFFWRFSFVTNKDLTSRSDKLVQQSGSSPKSVLSHQFPCLCLLTVPGHFVFPFSPLQIVDTFDRLLPPAEGLKQC